MKDLKILSVAAYANELLPFFPALYQDLDKVSRELVGFIPSVARNANGERATVGQAITIPRSKGKVAQDITPSMVVPNPNNDVSPEPITMTIQKSRRVGFALNGEETKGLNTGLGVGLFVQPEFAQAIRTLTNEIETDIALAAALAASRAYGTAGSTPFNETTKLSDAAFVRKILADNGSPLGELSLVIDTTAGANMRSLQQLTKVNEAGSAMTLRDGELLSLIGMSVKESAQIVTHVAGNAANAGVNASAYAIGATQITVGGGVGVTGAIKAGDYISFAGDSNKYLVLTGLANVSTAGVITISEPGLRLPIAAAAAPAVTVVADSVRNMLFDRDAIQLITRAPAMPDGGDVAADSMMITDARSGLTFEIRHYKGYHMNEYEVGMAWGVKAIKEAHIAALLG